jgi:hypothetical protein
VKTIDGWNNQATVSTGPVLGNANRGAFTVAAQAGSDVTLQFSLPTALTGQNGSLPISFSWLDTTYESLPVDNVYVEVTSGGFNSFDPINAWTFPTMEGGFPTIEAISGTNSVNVFIGGRVDATGVTSGSYTGTITLTATYN